MKHAILAAIVLLMVVAGVRWTHSGAERGPEPVVTSGSARVEAATCAECHPGQVANFSGAPHSQTLRPGDDPIVLERFAGRSAEVDGRRFRFELSEGELWLCAEDAPHARRVDWVFGSGHHAMTPVSIDQDPQGRPRLQELHVSWFADGSLRVTPGRADLSDHPPSLGRQDSPAKTQRCFGCHVSWLPEQAGRAEAVDLQGMVPNLDCSRCHRGAADHAASEGLEPLAFDWDELTALESINRCGECHRRADELLEGVADAEPEEVVRFAPVGLAMSPCFQQSNAPENRDRYPRLDCMTCHDPHTPARTEPEFFNDKCRQCHAPPAHPASETESAVTCSQQPVGASCIRCHMPKTKSSDGLYFTDHWIRSDTSASHAD